MQSVSDDACLSKELTAPSSVSGAQSLFSVIDELQTSEMAELLLEWHSSVIFLLGGSFAVKAANGGCLLCGNILLSLDLPPRIAASKFFIVATLNHGGSIDTGQVVGLRVVEENKVEYYGDASETGYQRCYKMLALPCTSLQSPPPDSSRSRLRLSANPLELCTHPRHAEESGRRIRCAMLRRQQFGKYVRRIAPLQGQGTRDLGHLARAHQEVHVLPTHAPG